MTEQQVKTKFTRWNFLTIIVFELVSVDLTIYEIFENLRAGLTDAYYMTLVVVVSFIVFTFLWLIGHEAFEVLIKVSDLF